MEIFKNAAAVEALELAHLLEKEVDDAKHGNLEEELQSVMLEKDLLKRCREDEKHLADNFLGEMEVTKSQKNVDMHILKSEISALKEKCRFLEENRGQLEKVENMARMTAAKNLVDQKITQYEIQMSGLQAEISDLQSARKSLEDAQNIAAMQREQNLKVKEAVELRMQLNDSMKTKQLMEQKLEVLQKKLDHQTAENEETKKRINSLMVEKASLEKQLETSNQGHKDIDKKLKTLDETSGQVLSLLKKANAEIMDKKRTHEKCINSETRVEVDKNKKKKPFGGRNIISFLSDVEPLCWNLRPS